MASKSELDILVDQLKKYMDLGSNKAFPQTGSFKGRPSKLSKQQLAELERAINNARADVRMQGAGNDFASKAARNRALLERFENSQSNLPSFTNRASVPSYMASDVVPRPRVVENVEVLGQGASRPEFAGRSVPLDVNSTARIVNPSLSAPAGNYPLVDRRSMDVVIKQQKDTLDKLKIVDKASKDIERVEKAKTAAKGSVGKMFKSGVASILGAEGGSQIGDWAARNIADVFTDDQGVIDTAGNVGSIAGGLGGVALNFIPAGRIANVAGKLLIPARAANLVEKGLKYGVPTLGGASLLSGLFSDPPSQGQQVENMIAQNVGGSRAPESDLSMALRNLVEINRGLANSGADSQRRVSNIRDIVMPNLRAIARQ